MLRYAAALIPIFLLGLSLTMATDTTAAGDAKFASKLYHQLANAQGNGNLIVSPVSIRTGLALLYLGADGITEQQLKQGLELQTASSKSEVAQQFAQLVTKKAKVPVDGEDVPELKYANRIYVAPQYQLATAYQDLVGKNFNASAENVNFALHSKATAEHINTWVEEQTKGHIKNLISSDSLDASTAAVLINAIYFKGNWLQIFEEYQTEPREFTSQSGQKVKVDTMYQSDYFQYADLPELKAKALELPYENTDIVFLILLPHQEQGLSDLEEQLKNLDLNEISSKLKQQKVEVQLPKFKYEFDVSMQPVLEKLGLVSLFSGEANFNSLLQSPAPLHISEVKHKALIEVNEKGTTATGATFSKVVLELAVIGEVTYEFTVDHPFFFAIKDKQNTYFLGHVTTLN
ncbi:serine protease inhibitor 42Dd isoform X1 [Drosophila tropicalis]|uniref:serine protease inhibitor 42Dd isoform X1 n=2 Tax=Drosophila tropicalis TaxID=46794 RepID=UPI0035AB7D11